MERMIAYHLCCRDYFNNRLVDENFIIKGNRQIKTIMPKEEDICLGRIYDSDVVIYPETNTMSIYSISERTKLIRMCDEFKA